MLQSQQVDAERVMISLHKLTPCDVDIGVAKDSHAVLRANPTYLSKLLDKFQISKSLDVCKC